ncbi:hypothetical protein BT63DRAFT_423052 [Microthyrium microscopicum]|uniref:Uncharacterized protein n=1 Tax=Microthyrium microscopicum TaxID=703497 RepID=A0A6A6UIP1_9PEZI|nr:hypothetical protein BT63DRAFT_423052 [Microthyrium microscopicum]
MLYIKSFLAALAFSQLGYGVVIRSADTTIQGSCGESSAEGIYGCILDGSGLNYGCDTGYCTDEDIGQSCYNDSTDGATHCPPV